MIYILMPIFILLVIVFAFALTGKRIEIEDKTCKELTSTFMGNKSVEFEVRKFPLYIRAIFLVIIGVLFTAFSSSMIGKFIGVTALIFAAVKVSGASKINNIRLTPDCIEYRNKKLHWLELSGVEIRSGRYANYLLIFLKCHDKDNEKSKRKIALSISSDSVMHFQALSECVHRKLGVPLA